MGQVVLMKEWKSDHPRTTTSSVRIGAMHVTLTFERPEIAVEIALPVLPAYEEAMRQWLALWGLV
jgi:hypothetical protein